MWYNSGMITKEMIDRINWLAHKKKTLGLSEKEQAEQKELYKEYLESFRANLKAQLDAIEIVDDDRTVAKETKETLSSDGKTVIEETVEITKE